MYPSKAGRSTPGTKEYFATNVMLPPQESYIRLLSECITTDPDIDTHHRSWTTDQWIQSFHRVLYKQTTLSFQDHMLYLFAWDFCTTFPVWQGSLAKKKRLKWYWMESCLKKEDGNEVGLKKWGKQSEVGLKVWKQTEEAVSSRTGLFMRSPIPL